MLTTRAEPAAAQGVGAEVLYQRGRALLKRGDVAAACQAFADSLRLEEAVGTMLNLADCREREGKLASAWSIFLNAASLASRSNARPQADEARQRAAQLAPRLSYLTISVADGNRIEGLAITRDGEPVDESLWNQGVPIDGGRHVVVATAVGNQPVSIEIEVAAADDTATAELPRLKRIEDFAVAPAVGPPAAIPAPPLDDDAPPPAPRAGRLTPLRWTAIGGAVVGLGAVGAGVALGLRANDTAARSRALCPRDPCSDPAAIALSDRAGRDATRANVALVAGGVVVAGAVTLWLVGGPTRRHDRRTAHLAPVLHRDEVGLVVQGRF